MSIRKTLAVASLALIGVLTYADQSQAFGKRRGGNNNNCCPQPVAQQSCCGAGYAMAQPSCCGSGYAAMPATGGVPYAMPMPGGTNVVPASGTRVNPDGTVIPATGTTTIPGTVIPSGGIVNNGYVTPASGMYYNPATGSYYYPNGSMYSGMGSYSGGYYGNTYSTPRRGLFRRY